MYDLSMERYKAETAQMNLYDFMGSSMKNATEDIPYQQLELSKVMNYE